MIRSVPAIVALLTGLNLLNYLDRYLIAAVGPSIQKELGLSDAQLGTIGTAFLWGYLLTSPIFGRLGDRFARKTLITIGVLVWCAATAASGLARTFLVMIAIRVLVGVGEASYATLSPTILDDIATPKNKSRILAVFFAAIPVGSALGFVFGGMLDKAFGWRSAFFIAGGPGILLALSCLLIVEPPRGEKEAAPSLGPALRSIVRSRRYVLAAVGYTAQIFALGGFAFWAPQVVHRKFAYPLAEANFLFGGIVVVTGFVGTFLGGFLADRGAESDRMKVALKVCAVSAVLGVPFAFACVFSTTAPLFFGTIALAQIAIFTSTSPLNAALLGTVPTHVRATGMALSIAGTHLLGDMISVWLVGFLSTRWNDLSGALIVLPVALAVCAAAWIAAAKAPALTAEELGSVASLDNLLYLLTISAIDADVAFRRPLAMRAASHVVVTRKRSGVTSYVYAARGSTTPVKLPSGEVTTSRTVASSLARTGLAASPY
jgi:MFS family permease